MEYWSVRVMQITCPVCKKKTTWEENPWRPFCSERCKLIDLGKWASEEYRVLGEEKEEGEKAERKEEQKNAN